MCYCYECHETCRSETPKAVMHIPNCLNRNLLHTATPNTPNPIPACEITLLYCFILCRLGTSTARVELLLGWKRHRSSSLMVIVTRRKSKQSAKRNKHTPLLACWLFSGMDLFSRTDSFVSFKNWGWRSINWMGKSLNPKKTRKLLIPPQEFFLDLR